MMSPVELEEQYLQIVQDLDQWNPEGIIEIDLHLLHELGLLNEIDELGKPEHPLTHYFYVIESAEKMTLFNDQFAVWIVPQMVDHEPITYGLIAVQSEDEVRLELVFAAMGVYNSSRIVLQVLEAFLEEIRETEEYLSRIDKE